MNAPVFEPISSSTAYGFAIVPPDADCVFTKKLAHISFDTNNYPPAREGLPLVYPVVGYWQVIEAFAENVRRSSLAYSQGV